MPRKLTPDPPPDPELREDPTAAAQKLNERILLGEDLINREIQARDGLDELQKEFGRWDDYNTELLRRMFTSPKFADEYAIWGYVIGGSDTPQEALRRLREDIGDKINRLRSIRDRLELVPIAAGVQQSASAVARTHTNRVFVVHGHDDAAREAVARFLERLGIEAIILHEQASGGRTIVEKLEHYGDVDFAVVLLTPDDVGKAAAGESGEFLPRARQNVVLELGYFVGKLGRTNVCTLYKPDLELPSDLLGVVYVPIDAGGAWRLQLAKELRASGFSVDMNLVV